MEIGPYGYKFTCPECEGEGVNDVGTCDDCHGSGCIFVDEEEAAEFIKYGSFPVAY